MQDAIANGLCNICPRECYVNRTEGETGFCGCTDRIMIARAALHMWEEPCISGKKGSGTIFFSGCNMRCVFCQNHDISTLKVGKEVGIKRLAEIMHELKEKDAENINLVTPTHYVNQIAEALRLANIDIPVVYNTSSYEKPESLRKLKGLVDVYLPDCKYFSDELAIKYSTAPDYFNIALSAIEEMLHQVGEPGFDERGMIIKGVIVRHLVLPSHTEDSKKVIRKLYERFGDSIYISIMSQYTPIRNADNCPELLRKITRREYNKVVDYALMLGVKNGFIQEGEVAKESFIPPFDLSGV